MWTMDVGCELVVKDEWCRFVSPGSSSVCAQAII